MVLSGNTILQSSGIAPRHTMVDIFYWTVLGVHDRWRENCNTTWFRDFDYYLEMILLNLGYRFRTERWIKVISLKPKNLISPISFDLPNRFGLLIDFRKIYGIHFIQHCVNRIVNIFGINFREIISVRWISRSVVLGVERNRPGVEILVTILFL